jgi:hydrogenase-4 component B
VLLGVGVVSALAGVLYALVQRELKRLLAFSSVENVGIIVAALGASVVLSADGQPLWATIAFGAALLHTLNHAAFKALLFLAAGAFGHAAGSLQLDQLGGLLRRMPWTGWSFIVGCAAIAGLPPLNGFASEWLTLQSLLHVGESATPGVSVAGTVALTGVAATAALAVFCFVKVVGLVTLGLPRTALAADAHEPPVATRVALTSLAGACLVLGAVPGLIFPTLAGLAPGELAITSRTTLALPSTGHLPTLGVLVALMVVFAIVLRLTTSARRAPATPAWASGQPIEPALAWTSAGFTKPLRLVLEVLFRPRRELELTETAGGVERVRYRAEVPHLFDDVLYAPVNRQALRGAATVRRLQSGSLRTYIMYLLGLVLALLALVRFGGLA